MSRLTIHQIPLLQDNYGYLLHEPQAKVTAVVDPAVSEPILRALAKRDWSLDYILNTHHHYDHTGGNLELKRATGCKIIGPRHDSDRIPGIDLGVSDGDTARIGGAEGEVIAVDGHTHGHIAYWFRESRALFCGDTLFSLGCGRLFEGEPEEMWESLKRLRILPDDSLVFCGHEYTPANARFALSIDPDNPDLLARVQEVEKKRTKGQSTVPSTLEMERRANPFLRADVDAIARAVGMQGASPAQVFAEIRRRKDAF
ncbi:MAG: hydroxyacylglutathione hydrolase [Alphaproteobacteria bacterium]|nr:hydroxyacylglutathione hydrolase [Alphaproteobacteria bacterium]